MRRHAFGFAALRRLGGDRRCLRRSGQGYGSHNGGRCSRHRRRPRCRRDDAAALGGRKWRLGRPGRQRRAGTAGQQGQPQECRPNRAESGDANAARTKRQVHGAIGKKHAEPARRGRRVAGMVIAAARRGVSACTPSSCAGAGNSRLYSDYYENGSYKGNVSKRWRPILLKFCAVARLRQ